jgi:hypothetical protein
MSIIEQKKRIETLMGLNNVKQHLNEHKDVEFSKKGADGKIYAIVREQHKFYIMEGLPKKDLMVEDLKYISGVGNKHKDNYPNYERALVNLQLKLQNINENVNGIKNNKPIDCFKSEFHLLEEQLKRNKNNANKDNSNWSDTLKKMKVNFDKKNSTVTLMNEGVEDKEDYIEINNSEEDNEINDDVVANDETIINDDENVDYLDYKSLFELGDKSYKNSNQIKNDLFNLGVTHGNEFGVPLSEVEKILLNYDISLADILNDKTTEVVDDNIEYDVDLSDINKDETINLNEDNIDGEVTDYVTKVIANLNPKAVKFSGDKDEGFSVLVKDTNSNFSAWVDVYIPNDSKDVSVDWNEYIFNLDNSNDIKQKRIQEDNEVFDVVTSEAVNFLSEKGLLVQDENGEWSYSEKVNEDVELDDEYEIVFENDEDEIVDETAIAGSRTHQTGRKQHTKLSSFPDSRLRPEDKKNKGEIEENTTAGGSSGAFEGHLFKEMNESIKTIRRDILNDVSLKKK